MFDSTMSQIQYLSALKHIHDAKWHKNTDKGLQITSKKGFKGEKMVIVRVNNTHSCEKIVNNILDLQQPGRVDAQREPEHKTMSWDSEDISI